METARQSPNKKAEKRDETDRQSPDKKAEKRDETAYGVQTKAKNKETKQPTEPSQRDQTCPPLNRGESSLLDN